MSRLKEGITKSRKYMFNKREGNTNIEKCPNCGHELNRFLGEWVCSECEYHSISHPSKKISKGSFR